MTEGCPRAASLTCRVAVLAAVLLGVSPPATVAQPEICARPTRPEVPAGETAEFGALAAARDAIDTYLLRMQDYLDCLQQESTAAAAETDGVVDQWNEAVNAFEARQRQ